MHKASFVFKAKGNNVVFNLLLMNFVWLLFADFKVEFVEWLHIFCKHVYMQTCVNTVNVYRLREAIPVNSVLLFFLIVLAPYMHVSVCANVCVARRSCTCKKL